MKLNLYFICCIFTFSYSNAQEFNQNWEGHFSYFNASGLSTSPQNIYAAAENAYFTYNTINTFTETTSTINGLSGEKISAIYHSNSFQLTVLGYESGLIQLVMDNNQNVFSVVDILNKVSISPNQKRINHFFEYENKLYISTDFGIAVYNLENLEFGDSFFIGNNAAQLQINQTHVFNNIIYAASTTGGIRYAAVNNPDLVDFNEWQSLGSSSWKQIQATETQLFAMRFDNRLFELSGTNLSLVEAFPQEVRDFRAEQNQIVLCFPDQVEVYDANFNLQFFVSDLPETNLDLNTAVSLNNGLYLADRNLGVLKISDQNQTDFVNITPDGPLSNKVFSVEVQPGHIWCVYGEYTQFFNPFPLTSRGASHFRNGEWFNLSFEDLDQTRELSDITYDPQNFNRVFLSSYFDGLLEIEDDVVVNHYQASNSNIQGVPSNINDNRIGASAFNNQGDLYFTNSLSEFPLKQLSSSGTIQGLDTSEGFVTATNEASSKIAVDPQGNAYFASFKTGVIAFEAATGKSGAINSNIDGVDFPDAFNENPSITALEFDQNNRLWIGTNVGLRVAFSPAGIFEEEPFVTVSPIIIEDVDGLAQELLFEQFITDIAIDGANNKWIATADSGVVQVSSNGQDVLNIFTEDNSPLPTNSVRSVSVDQDTGVVYFGTTQGLVSYNTNITGSNEDLENVRVFPNPVRPGYNGLVTIDGLMDDANVKITDISGNLVYEETVNGGTIQWDTTAFGRHKVASGVYLVLITGADQVETKVAKIMIIR